MESAGVLLLAQVDQTEVEGSDPLKRVKVQGLFEAGDASDILLLTIEAHSDVVPHF